MSDVRVSGTFFLSTIRCLVTDRFISNGSTAKVRSDNSFLKKASAEEQAGCYTGSADLGEMRDKEGEGELEGKERKAKRSRRLEETM